MLPSAIGRHPFAGSVGVGVRNQGRYLAIFGAADPDAPLVARVRLLIGLRVGRVEHVLPVDEHAARPAELSPLRQEHPVLVEDLNPAVPAVGDKQPAVRVHREIVWRVELTRAGPLLSPRLDELPVFRELHDARVRLAAVAVGDEDVAVRSDQDVGRLIERIGTVAGDSRLAQRHQDLAIGAELEHLVTLHSPGIAVGHPHVALPVHMNAVRADEHPRAKALHNLP